MQFVRHTIPQAFYEAVQDFLLENELLNNVVLGLLLRMIHQGETFGGFYLGHVENSTGDVVAATMLARMGAILSCITDKAARPVLVDAYAETYDTLLNVVGEPLDSAHFAQLWQQKKGVAYHTQMEYLYYRLDEVIPPNNVSGYVRQATEDDFELLVNWLIQFSYDTGLDRDQQRADAEANIRRKLEKPILGGICIWMDNGKPVSMAAATRELPNGGNVSLVYTPQTYRGKGYASAVTAAVSQNILDAGKTFACLATDASNPTSNKIYQAIGYQFFGNHRLIKFENTSGEA